jgi:hypothetical protein
LKDGAVTNNLRHKGVDELNQFTGVDLTQWPTHKNLLSTKMKRGCLLLEKVK